MSTFPKMVDIVSPAAVGCAAVEHYEVSKLSAAMDSMRGMYTEPGKIAILKVNGITMMSDTDHEQRSNREIVSKARGHVFIAGLGLGMILHPILAKPEVASVTVVEKYQDVIDLILPTIPDAEQRLTIATADIFDFKPARKAKWDTIYFDIWSDMCSDNLKEIATLHQRFKSRKAVGGWMGSWAQAEMRDHLRRYGW